MRLCRPHLDPSVSKDENAGFMLVKWRRYIMSPNKEPACDVNITKLFHL